MHEIIAPMKIMGVLFRNPDCLDIERANYIMDLQIIINRHCKIGRLFTTDLSGQQSSI